MLAAHVERLVQLEQVEVVVGSAVSLPALRDRLRPARRGPRDSRPTRYGTLLISTFAAPSASQASGVSAASANRRAPPSIDVVVTSSPRRNPLMASAHR